MAVLSQKGGVGKTTLALHLAAARGRRWQSDGLKKRLALLDLDDQESLYRYRKTLKRTDFESVSLEKLPRALERAREDADCVILDAPRSLDDALTFALMSRVDFAVIPFIPEYDAVLAARRTLDVARRVRKERPEFGFRLVLMQSGGAVHRRELASEARALFSPWVCKTAIPSSPIVGAAARAGVSTFDCAPDSPVSRAFMRLELELLHIGESK
ncbi:MAG TPA: ParA family protein [Abditibacterium sp.]|jgi:chromosome partitioning protein